MYNLDIIFSLLWILVYITLDCVILVTFLRLSNEIKEEMAIKISKELAESMRQSDMSIRFESDDEREERMRFERRHIEY